MKIIQGEYVSTEKGWVDKNIISFCCKSMMKEVLSGKSIVVRYGLEDNIILYSSEKDISYCPFCGSQILTFDASTLKTPESVFKL